MKVRMLTELPIRIRPTTPSEPGQGLYRGVWRGGDTGSGRAGSLSCTHRSLIRVSLGASAGLDSLDFLQPHVSPSSNAYAHAQDGDLARAYVRTARRLRTAVLSEPMSRHTAPTSPYSSIRK